MHSIPRRQLLAISTAFQFHSIPCCLKPIIIPGFTNSNYPKLAELHKKYREKGFEILAFPCNQFLSQEPESSEKVEQFACTRFNAEYPIFHKIRVNGPKAAPVYKFLKAKKRGFCGSRIKWNFTKFLVDKEGRVIGRYGPSTSPLSIEGDIQKALNAQ
ncbi:hypothetical protein E3N88_33745 [Mikania micrantha]|uniref:Glutathione peroxidase n=1 Tax=Mikania micrantha TaxID=192012 RepID=A0A5N6MCA5_9ASTR|nr:hypothetical protein E3N88_33745 [Mikania micrantha]